MRATLSITYENDGSGTKVILTGVSGNWKALDSKTYIKSAKLVYGCSSISLISQSATKYPASSPFSYYTGFTKYVAKDGGSRVGGRLELTLARGGSTWQFTLENNVVSNNLGLF